MASLGDMLREAREARGISLVEAERETKIRQKYIAALEDDDVASLPGPVYARGFLRKYGVYLGFDPDEVVELFDRQYVPTRNKIRAARGEPEPTPKANEYPGVEKISIQPLSPEPIDTRVRYGISYIAVSLLAIPLIIVFYFIYSAYAGNSRGVPIPTVSPRPPTVTSLPTIASVISGVGTGAYNTPTVYVPGTPGGIIVTSPGATPGTAVAQGSPTPSDQVVVKLSTTRDAWLRVLVDGVQQFSGTLPKGSARQWTGTNTVRIRTGRADSVVINVNGVDKGLMGTPSNLIVEKEWNRSGAERVIQ